MLGQLSARTYSIQCGHSRQPGRTRRGVSFFQWPKMQQFSNNTKPRRARDEVLELIKKGAKGKFERQRCAEVVEQLMNACVPFDERLLGGGPWVAVYTQGPLLWQALLAPGKLLNPANKASQSFDPATRCVINRGELAGGRVYVTAEGCYETKGSTSSTPVLIQAAVQKGKLHVLGLDIPLPIRGTGDVSLMYLDDKLRIFKSPSGSVSLQVRQDSLQQLLA